MALTMFRCDKNQMVLSTVGCARLYASATLQKRSPNPFEGRAACRACPRGALHYYGTAPDPVTTMAASLRMVCSRCRRPSDRIIRRRLCASCDARHGEALRRRNGKGTVPALSDRLHTERLVVASGGSARVAHLHAALSATEMMIYMAKAAVTALAFGRPPYLIPAPECGN